MVGPGGRNMKNLEIKDLFESYLIKKSQELFSSKNELNEAILYSLLAPGKRIRPLLCLGFTQGFGASRDLAMSFALSIEMIHTYSLIHDDLPAMDNDDYRRGRQTNHKVFGEAAAILAGDSLLTLAPAFLLRESGEQNYPSHLAIELTGLLLDASGHRGMVLGQALDMRHQSLQSMAPNSQELEQTLKEIHRLKTGAIISWSCQAGLYATADQQLVQRYLPIVQEIGEGIGLLFQIVDDILDMTATLDEIGKTPGKDQEVGKLTSCKLYGLQGARSKGSELITNIQTKMQSLPEGSWEVIDEILHGLKEKLN
jgi:geranylgeranyl diphosphate synthase, type II